MIRALVVDDEAPARRKLSRLLAPIQDVEVVGEAGDGEAAIAAIAEHRPEVVFLDIQMPGRDGFEVIEAVGPETMPLVVFVTAFDEHALRAFEVGAVDYLSKPYSPSRLEKVLVRVRERLGGSGDDLAARLERVLAELEPRRPARERFLERLLARRDEDREALLAVGEIDLFRAQGNYVDLHARGEVYRRRDTLGRLEERLDPDRFLRVNRSEIVRLDAVAEIQDWFRGDKRIVLKDGTTVSWSRRYRKAGEEL